MIVVINGEENEVEVDEGCFVTIAQILEAIGVGARPVVVEINGIALVPREYPKTKVTDGDSLEIVEVTAGG